MDKLLIRDTSIVATTCINSHNSNTTIGRVDVNSLLQGHVLCGPSVRTWTVVSFEFGFYREEGIITSNQHPDNQPKFSTHQRDHKAFSPISRDLQSCMTQGNP